MQLGTEGNTPQWGLGALSHPDPQGAQWIPVGWIPPIHTHSGPGWLLMHGEQPDSPAFREVVDGSPKG